MYEHDADSVEMGNGEQQGDLGALAPQLGPQDLCPISQSGTQGPGDEGDQPEGLDGGRDFPARMQGAARILAVAALRIAREHVAASDAETGL